jgi:GTP cyclohydrolase II
VYLRQEGRGIGLGNKIQAYALQAEGRDTVDANHALGFGADLRDFGAAAEILKAEGVTRVRLATNNPDKVRALREAGVDVASEIRMLAPVNSANQRYLSTKWKRMSHRLDELADLLG